MTVIKIFIPLHLVLIMGKKRLLVEKRGKKYVSKHIYILDKVTDLSINKNSLKILSEIAKGPTYPREVADRLGMDEQLVYYYFRKLEKAGLIKFVREIRKGGVACKVYSLVSEAFGFEIAPSQQEITIDKTVKVEKFFDDFVSGGVFDGSIVVGAPVPHGPYLTTAHDGHYTSQLTMFLGGICELPKRFIVKLDTEVKSEHEERRNLILIGGPLANIISAELNEKLKVKFKWKEGWKLISEISGKEYSDENVSLVAKVKNPWDTSKKIILLAGLKSEGTKTSIIAVTHFFDRLFDKYIEGKDFYAIIMGVDKDGDGKVDDIEVLEETAV